MFVAAATVEPESTAADEDGATYEGVLQCRLGGRAWIVPSDGALGGRGRWGVGKQAYPRSQLFTSCVTGKGASKNSAKFHGHWRSPGDVFDGESSRPYYANCSHRSCQRCRKHLRGHLEELNKAQDADTLRDGEPGAADSGGEGSAPGQDACDMHETVQLVRRDWRPGRGGGTGKEPESWGRAGGERGERKRHEESPRTSRERWAGREQ